MLRIKSTMHDRHDRRHRHHRDRSRHHDRSRCKASRYCKMVLLPALSVAFCEAPTTAHAECVRPPGRNVPFPGRRIHRPTAARLRHPARGKRHPAVRWLLDEPTASLDPRSTVAVIDAIRTATTNRTVLVVTHDRDPAAIAGRVATLASPRTAGPARDPPQYTSSPTTRKDVNTMTRIIKPVMWGDRGRDWDRDRCWDWCW